MIHKLLIVGLFLAVSLDVCLGRPKTEAKAMQDLADALIQGIYYNTATIMIFIVRIKIASADAHLL